MFHQHDHRPHRVHVDPAEDRMNDPAHPTLPPTTPIEEIIRAVNRATLHKLGLANARLVTEAALTAARSAGFALVSVKLLEEAATACQFHWNDIRPADGAALSDIATALRQAAATAASGGGGK
jgi:hypothetical protein